MKGAQCADGTEEMEMMTSSPPIEDDKIQPKWNQLDMVVYKNNTLFRLPLDPPDESLTNGLQSVESPS